MDPLQLKIIDLPLEILGRIAAYLNRNDLKSLISAHKYLASNLTSELFHSISWRFSGYKSILRSTIDLDMAETHGHALAELLMTNETLAQHVRVLLLSWEICHFCDRDDLVQEPAERPIIEPCCDLVPVSFVKKFANLKSLHLTGDWEKMVTENKFPKLSQLKSLTLHHSHTTSGNQPEVSLERLFRHLVHPQLQHLTLENVVVRRPRRSEVDANYSFATSLRSITQLTIDCAAIDGPSLRKLLEELKELSTLDLTRQRQFSLFPEENDRASYQIGELEGSLQSCKKLEKLRLVHTEGVIDEEYGSLLGPMTSLSGLKCLVVDPSVVIGHRICPSLQDEDLIRPLSSLAAMLPDSLEHLVIVLDLAQANRINQYRAHLVEGLIKAKKEGRLNRLGKIIFVELLDYQALHDHLPCACAPSAQSPCQSWNPYIASHCCPINFKESCRFVEQQRICEGLGIDLVLIGEDDFTEQSQEWKDYKRVFEW